jgi:hypothetical protein
MQAILIALILASSVPLSAADKVQPLNVKVGQWQTTVTTTTGGQMPLPAELLSRLTPEQRARIEERMKANSAQKNKTNTYKNCVTKEQLEQGPKFGEEHKECTQTILSSTSSKAELRIACEKEDTKGTGTIQIEALSPESVKGSWQMSVTGGGHTLNKNNSFTAKWIGPVCSANN